MSANNIYSVLLSRGTSNFLARDASLLERIMLLVKYGEKARDGIGVRFYKDEQLSVKCAYSSQQGSVGLVVNLLGNGHEVLVFKADKYGIVQAYRFGKWEDYVCRLVSELQSKISFVDHVEDDFKPIDDSAIFL